MPRKASELLLRPSAACSSLDSGMPSSRGAKAASTMSSGTVVRKACAARTSERSNASRVLTWLTTRLTGS